MSNIEDGGTGLSKAVLSLLSDAIEKIAAESNVTRSYNGKPLFFPAGVGEISIDLAVAGASVSLVVSSDITSRPEPGCPRGSAHPMEVYPRWKATVDDEGNYDDGVYTIQLYKGDAPFGNPQLISAGKSQCVDIDKP